MIGLHYPEINFDNIKSNLQNLNIIASFIDLINQLEVKLIYLEKEINVTKLSSCYAARKIFLKENEIQYDEKNLTELHDIINWIIIHKSNQFKGIASDKYLACKYVKLKLGKNLCEQRIAVYNGFEDLTYKEISKYGNIVLKISNSCWKSVFIYKNTTIDIFEKIIKRFKKLSESEHGLIDAQFFHLYAKKRIIVEKQFIPRTDLYEFRFFIVNNQIQFLQFKHYMDMNYHFFFYDPYFNFIYKKKKEKEGPLNITSLFKKNLLKELKIYAIKLSEDFPNFIRVDLHVFHDKIYLSELTFASYLGKPMNRNRKFIKNAIRNFSLIDDHY